VPDTSADSLSKGDRAVIEVAPSLRWAIAKPERPTSNGDAKKAGEFNDPPPTY
jgi:hypothetical protein